MLAAGDPAHATTGCRSNTWAFCPPRTRRAPRRSRSDSLSPPGYGARTETTAALVWGAFGGSTRRRSPRASACSSECVHLAPAAPRGSRTARCGSGSGNCYSRSRTPLEDLRPLGCGHYCYPHHPAAARAAAARGRGARSIGRSAAAPDCGLARFSARSGRRFRSPTRVIGGGSRRRPASSPPCSRCRPDDRRSNYTGSPRRAGSSRAGSTTASPPSPCRRTLCSSPECDRSKM
mmetsp:Transcript_26953/g.67907  ORF Transcript_26953/g.67907 Transcript_26953/m.67907 type:complete len:234 (+) Transcript_26953:1755-2456(+)